MAFTTLEHYFENSTTFFRQRIAGSLKKRQVLMTFARRILSTEEKSDDNIVIFAGSPNRYPSSKILGRYVSFSTASRRLNFQFSFKN